MERDYVLGTHDDELARLGLQHGVWRPTVLDAWRRADIRPGAAVLDVGCGPGYATQDLAEWVGPRGRVLGVERSTRFVQATNAALASAGRQNARCVELDLMDEPIPDGPYDAAWCRWVACFVPDPARLVRAVAAALRPGGWAVFHEYSNYASWRLAPYSAPIEGFVAAVMQSWRAAGGEPDIALALPTLLADAGLEVQSMRPHLFVAAPGEPMWQWPASFMDINLARLRELGYVDADFVTEVREALAVAAANPDARMFTPTVLEIIATKSSA